MIDHFQIFRSWRTSPSRKNPAQTRTAKTRSELWRKNTPNKLPTLAKELYPRTTRNASMSTINKQTMPRLSLTKRTVRTPKPTRGAWRKQSDSTRTGMCWWSPLDMAASPARRSWKSNESRPERSKSAMTWPRRMPRLVTETPRPKSWLSCPHNWHRWVYACSKFRLTGTVSSTLCRNSWMGCPSPACAHAPPTTCGVTWATNCLNYQNKPNKATQAILPASPPMRTACRWRRRSSPLTATRWVYLFPYNLNSPKPWPF